MVRTQEHIDCEAHIPIATSTAGLMFKEYLCLHGHNIVPGTFLFAISTRLKFDSELQDHD
jgi:hypothetical protein